MNEAQAAECMALQLDVLEGLIRQELAELERHRGKLFRGEPKQLRLLDLTDGLAAVAPARAALARCPAGAELASYVLQIAFCRARRPVELANHHYAAAQKGNVAAKAKQASRTKRAHAKLRRQAKDLSAHLNVTAKAKFLARTSSLSESRIRHIIAK